MPFGFRADGDKVKNLPATRRIMPFLMPTRNESAVYFEQRIPCAQLNAFMERARGTSGLRITAMHVMIAAITRVLHERPRLNRFVAGHRHYQRRGIWVSFSAKKKKTDDAPIAVVKRSIDPQASFADVVRYIDEGTGIAKGDARTSTDKELSFFLSLPVWMLAWALSAVRVLDRFGLLPQSFIDGDPMFSSVFIANLGSLGMAPAFHHLYEYGNIPLFITMGKQEVEAFVDEEGVVGVRTVLPLRYTFDERVEDGLYCLTALQRLEEIMRDPAAVFSC